ncbi:MAG: hypothetical protein ACRYFV_24805 [Janthinobacterium lividum]
MPLCPLVDTSGLSISYDADNQWQYVEWKGKHDPVSSWAACALMLDTLRAFPCSKILNDNSGIKRTTMQLSARSLAWLAQMHAAGLQCLAWVLPEKLASRRTTEGIVLQIAAPAVCTFDELASAYEWLQRQPSNGPAGWVPEAGHPLVSSLGGTLPAERVADSPAAPPTSWTLSTAAPAPVVARRPRGDTRLAHWQAQATEHLADEQFGPAELAELLGLSERTLYRRLGELAGLTPTAWLRELRLDQARSWGLWLGDAGSRGGGLCQRPVFCDPLYRTLWPASRRLPGLSAGAVRPGVGARICPSARRRADLTLELGGRPVFADDGELSVTDQQEKLIYNRTASLPGGRIYGTCQETTAMGHLGCPNMIGAVDGQPLNGFKADLKNGELINMRADTGVESLQKTMAPYGPAALQVDRFSIGLNPVLRTQKDFHPINAAGMVLVGTGNNALYGGQNQMPGSANFPITNATVDIDGRVIVRNGQLVTTVVASSLSAPKKRRK